MTTHDRAWFCGTMLAAATALTLANGAAMAAPGNESARGQRSDPQTGTVLSQAGAGGGRAEFQQGVPLPQGRTRHEIGGQTFIFDVGAGAGGDGAH